MLEGVPGLVNCASTALACNVHCCNACYAQGTVLVSHNQLPLCVLYTSCRFKRQLYHTKLILKNTILSVH